MGTVSPWHSGTTAGSQQGSFSTVKHCSNCALTACSGSVSFHIFRQRWLCNTLILQGFFSPRKCRLLNSSCMTQERASEPALHWSFETPCASLWAWVQNRAAAAYTSNNGQKMGKQNCPVVSWISNIMGKGIQQQFIPITDTRVLFTLT